MPPPPSIQEPASWCTRRLSEISRSCGSSTPTLSSPPAERPRHPTNFFRRRSGSSLRLGRLAVFEGGETLTSHRRLLGLREIVDQILKTGLGDLRLLQLDERGRFLVEGRGRLLTAGIVRDDLPKFLDRLPELFVGALGLSAIGEAAGQDEKRHDHQHNTRGPRQGVAVGR